MKYILECLGVNYLQLTLKCIKKRWTAVWIEGWICEQIGDIASITKC